MEGGIENTTFAPTLFEIRSDALIGVSGARLRHSSGVSDLNGMLSGVTAWESNDNEGASNASGGAGTDDFGL